ncbi:hypothetical protein [Microbacterium sp. NC79]|uniref:hypothetical protein n=1 Tax=Microbacterium sp. NC79 TaxID=2851009 RepID=UPI001C2C1762|nr:hypothetical protein [Microbacterium sp. NC79]MBV0894048.1 hypothetical protein [Microbacterium sp. NC79]
MRGTIILNADVLRSQGRSLAAHASDLGSAASQAQVAMPATAFGLLNSYLPGPCNALAGQSASLLSAASDLLDAMGQGVDGVLKAFENIETEASAVLDGYEP